jgi:hypothetical protein
MHSVKHIMKGVSSMVKEPDVSFAKLDSADLVLI